MPFAWDISYSHKQYDNTEHHEFGLPPYNFNSQFENRIVTEAHENQQNRSSGYALCANRDRGKLAQLLIEVANSANTPLHLSVGQDAVEVLGTLQIKPKQDTNVWRNRVKTTIEYVNSDLSVSLNGEGGSESCKLH